jgi:hypothetical protein
MGMWTLPQPLTQGICNKIVLRLESPSKLLSFQNLYKKLEKAELERDAAVKATDLSTGQVFGAAMNTVAMAFAGMFSGFRTAVLNDTERYNKHEQKMKKYKARAKSTPMQSKHDPDQINVCTFDSILCFFCLLFTFGIFCLLQYRAR